MAFSLQDILFKPLARVTGREASDLLERLWAPFGPETVRGIQTFFLRDQAWPEQKENDPAVLKTTVWGLNFPNPVGVAGGYDPDVRVVDQLYRIGFGFAEVGTVTDEPDNVPRRVFRWNEDEAILSQNVGFPNKGAKEITARLTARRGRKALIVTSVGETPMSEENEEEDIIETYIRTLRQVAPVSDYVVVNIGNAYMQSLMEFQIRDRLSTLLKECRQAVSSAAPINTPPLLLKVATDLNDAGKKDTAELVLEHDIDGMIVGGGTSARPENLKSEKKKTPGLLSGKPAFEKTTWVLKEMYYYTQGKIPLIGCGGVMSGEDAYRKIRGGASLVQMYSALIYHGPPHVQKVKKELAACLKRDGFSNVSEAVGADLRG